MKKVAESKKQISEIKNILRFQEILDAQQRESDKKSSDIASKLFEPYLERVRDKVHRDDHVLDAYPYFEVDLQFINPVIPYKPKPRKYLVKLHFVWLPKDHVDIDEVNQAEFTEAELKVVQREVKKFATKIGYPVDVVYVSE